MRACMSVLRGLALIALLQPAWAFAHARLTSPTPRNTAANKTGPCGSPRTANATTFAPGATITVTWTETINHPGYYRIAFSPSGDTGFDANVLLNNIPNPAGLQANNSATVTLPTTPCTQCTLQLIQVMTDDNPPTNYFSCADITISAANTPPTIAQAAAATVASTTAALTVRGADNAGEAALRYTWAMVSGPAAVTFSANGTNAAKNTTATFTRAGAYSFRVTVADAANLTATSTVNVMVAAALTSLRVTPMAPMVTTGATRQFTGTALDQFATALVTQPAMTWTVSGGGTINAAGLFTAGSATGGPHTITAAAGGRMGTATVTIIAPTPPTVMTPAAAMTPAAGATTVSLSALGSDAAGEAGLLYTWSATTAPAPVTFDRNGTNAAKSVVATLTRGGAYTFQVSIKNGANLTVTSSTTVTVAPALTTIAVTPVTASVPINGMQAFTASATDQFMAALASQPTFTWTTTGGGTISAAGVFVAGTMTGGPFNVRAASGGKQGTATVMVTTMDAPRVMTPASASPAMVTGTTSALSVLGADDTGEAGLVYTWSAKSPPAAVTFSASGTNAAKDVTVTFAKAGTYELEVEIKDASGKTAMSGVDVTVVSTLTRVDVSPAEGTVAPGQELAFTAAGSDQFDVALATEPAYAWTVSGGGTIAADGAFTAGAEPGGPHTVTAESGGKTGTARVTVAAGPVVDRTPPVVTVSSPSEGEPVTGNVELTATATDDVGVVEVAFKLDGVRVARATSAPWKASWNTQAAADGEHTLVAEARDAAGNIAASPPVKLVVDNPNSQKLKGVGCSASGGGALLLLAVALLRRRAR